MALYTRHLGIALGIARDYYLPGGDADDVRQEARIALWEATGVWDPERGSFPAFVRLVVHRRIQDAIKNASRKKRMIVTDALREYEDIGRLDPLEQRDALRDLTRRCAELNEAERVTLARIVNEIPLADKSDDNRRYLLRKKLAPDASGE